MTATSDPHFAARQLTYLCQAIRGATLFLAKEDAAHELRGEVLQQRSALEALAMSWLAHCEITLDLRNDICVSGSHALLMCTPPPKDRGGLNSQDSLLEFCSFVGPDYYRVWIKHQYVEGQCVATLLQLAHEKEAWIEVLGEMLDSPIFRYSLTNMFTHTGSFAAGLGWAIKTYPTIVPRLLAEAIQHEPAIGGLLLDKALHGGKQLDKVLPVLWALGAVPNMKLPRLVRVLSDQPNQHEKMQLLSPCKATAALAERPMQVRATAPAGPVPAG